MIQYSTRTLLFVFLLLTFNCTLVADSYAQEITLFASVDKRKISLDEQLVLKVSVSGDISSLPSPKIPPIPGFSSYSSGRTQNVSIINGKVSSSLTFNYILVPQSAGKHTIPSIELVHKGKTYKTSPIQVEVVSTRQPPSTTPPVTPPSAAPQTPVPSAPAKEFFITGTLNKSRAYVGEEVIYTFQFWRRTRLLSNPRYQPPDFTGFWTEDLPPQRNYYTEYQGSRYLVTEIKTALFPLSSGKFTISPSYLQVSVDDFSPDRFFSDDFFRNFFSGGRRVQLKTAPLVLTVLPFPEQNKPQNFEGAVGDYQIKVSWDKEVTEAFQPVTLIVEITGRGNVKTISNPEYPSFKGFKKYETISSLNLSKEGYHVSGSKVFKTVLVPQRDGLINLPEIKFAFFDPKLKKYREISSAPPLLRIKPGKKQETVISGISPEEVRILGQDIRHLKTPETLIPAAEPLYQKTWFIILQFFPLILLFGSYGWVKQKERLTQNVELVRKKRAFSNAKRELKSARRIRDASKSRAFYILLSKALNDYLADKLNLPAAGMTQNDVENGLKKMNAGEEMIKKVLVTMEEIDLARFTSTGSDLGQMNRIHKNISELIARLEKILK